MGLQLGQGLDGGEDGDGHQLPHPIVQAPGIAEFSENVPLENLHELPVCPVRPGGALVKQFLYLLAGSLDPIHTKHSFQLNLPYSSSLTGSSHSLEQPSPGISMAMWLNHVSFLAPCQCLTPAGMTMTVPGVRLCASLPSS